MIRYTMGPHIPRWEKSATYAAGVIAEECSNVFWDVARILRLPQFINWLSRKLE